MSQKLRIGLGCGINGRRDALVFGLLAGRDHLVQNLWIIEQITANLRADTDAEIG